MDENGISGVMARIEGVKDVLSVGRVFGDAYQVGDTTVIPVAVVRGGGGGGGGEGTGEQHGRPGSGSGGGMGFGVNARPIGVYVVQGDKVTWQPAVDVMRLALGGQLLALAAILTFGRLRRRRG